MSTVPVASAAPSAPAGRPARVVGGPARLGRRTKVLVNRLAAGDIAVIDHKGLDRISAEDLIAAGVGGVLNCRQSSSDTYPNMGPLLVRRQILTIHDAAVFAHPEWFDWRFAMANRLVLPRLARRVRHVVEAVF